MAPLVSPESFIAPRLVEDLDRWLLIGVASGLNYTRLFLCHDPYDVLRLRAAQSTTKTTSSGAARSVPPHPLTLQPQPAVQVTVAGLGKLMPKLLG